MWKIGSKVEAPAFTSVTRETMLVPRASIATPGHEASLTALFADSIFADGLVSYDRVQAVQSKYNLPPPVQAALAKGVDDAVAKHGTLATEDRLQTELGGRLTKVELDIATFTPKIKDANWVGTPGAAEVVAAIRDRWNQANAATAAMAAIGMHHASWYPAWVGRATAIEGSLNTFESSFKEAVRAARTKESFADDVNALSTEQFDKLRAGLEKAAEGGIVFACNHDSYARPAPHILANILEGMPVAYAVPTLHGQGSELVPILNNSTRKPIASFQELVAVIKRFGRVDLAGELGLT